MGFALLFYNHLQRLLIYWLCPSVIWKCFSHKVLLVVPPSSETRVFLKQKAEILYLNQN